jgi:hypothetical protein
VGIDISTPWGDVIKTVGGLISRVIPDKAAADAANAQLAAMALAGQLNEEMTQLVAVTTAQTDINKVEAASTSIFIAGARPFIMWVCGVGLAMSCIIGPLFTWATALLGHPTPFPKLDDPLLQSTMAGLLGLGHISRTVEKIKGVVGQH